MRYIIVDEAGVSAKEPVTIVVGLIVHADRQVMSSETAIKEVLGAVPPSLAKGFVFHATDVFSNKKYRDGWSQTDRFALLHDMMSLPSKLGIPVCFGMVRRSAPAVAGIEQAGLSPAEFHHIKAFTQCVVHADRYMRRYAEPSEVGTVIAEDAPKIKRFVKVLIKDYRENPQLHPPESIQWTQADLARGYTTQRGDFRVSRIRGGILFAEKSEEPLLQMADACAFGLRRYFSGQSHGEEFARTILGEAPNLDDFSGPMSVSVVHGVDVTKR